MGTNVPWLATWMPWLNCCDWHRFVLPSMYLLNRYFQRVVCKVIEWVLTWRVGQEDLVSFRMCCHLLWCVARLCLHLPMRGLDWRVLNSHCFLMLFHQASSVPLPSKYWSSSCSSKPKYFHETWLGLETSAWPISTQIIWKKLLPSSSCWRKGSVGFDWKELVGVWWQIPVDWSTSGYLSLQSAASPGSRSFICRGM